MPLTPHQEEQKLLKGIVKQFLNDVMKELGDTDQHILWLHNIGDPGEIATVKTALTSARNTYKQRKDDIEGAADHAELIIVWDAILATLDPLMAAEWHDPIIR